MVRPTTSCHSSFRRAAAVELSTPPLMATAIFIFYIFTTESTEHTEKKIFGPAYL